MYLREKILLGVNLVTGFVLPGCIKSNTFYDFLYDKTTLDIIPLVVYSLQFKLDLMQQILSMVATCVSIFSGLLFCFFQYKNGTMKLKDKCKL